MEEVEGYYTRDISRIVSRMKWEGGAREADDHGYDEMSLKCRSRR